MKRKACFVLLIALAAAPLLLAREYKLVPSEHVPGATGWAEVERDDNGNVTVAMEVRHLANPTRLSPARQMYIVWVRPRSGGEVEKAGMLRVSDELKGSIRFLTVYPTFDLVITAEDDMNVSQPSGQEVLRTAVDQ